MDQIYEEISDTAMIRKIHTPPTPDHRELRRRLFKRSLPYLLALVAAYGFFCLSHRYIVQAVRVQGSSMMPTLSDGGCYLLNRLVFSFRDPKPMDIVALQDPEDKGLAVKRIVARPGDRVFLSDGKVFVNGKALAEIYLDGGTKTFPDPRYRAQMWICGLNQYFVLGDNRNKSADSRLYGAVPRQNILGLVVPLGFADWF